MSTKRGKAFTPALDIVICNAYLCISQDSVVGNSQSQSVFWSRVLDEYTNNTKDDARTINSIQSRWRDIQKLCGKWSGYVKSIEAKNQSGQTEADKVEEANRLYRQIHNKDFPFHHCWAILQEHVKWQNVPDTSSRARTSTMGTTSTPPSPACSQIPGNFVSLDSDNTPTGGSVESPRKRPLGSKKVKEAKRKSKMADEKNEKFCSLLDAFNKNVLDKIASKAEKSDKQTEMEERKTKAMEEIAANEKMKNEMQIMNMIADPQTRHYYAMLKNDIMEKMVARQPPQPYFPEFTGFSQE